MTKRDINEDMLEDYANAICFRSRIAADAVRIYLSESEHSTYPKQETGAIMYAGILLEFVTLFLSFTDRVLYWEVVSDEHMDIQLRDDLMDKLVERCINSSVDYCWFGLEENARREYKKSSFNVHNARMEQYAKYRKYLPEKNEGAKDTLIWEFGKNICKIVERDHDISLKVMCLKIIVDAFKELDPNSFIKKMK